MSISSASGYTQLPQTGNNQAYWVPQIYSQKVIKAFRKISVIEDITNTDYYGEISSYGDTVRVVREPDVTINSYTRGLTMASSVLSATEFTLSVDQANYFQFQVDDIEIAHSHLNWESLASDRAAYKLKDAFDTSVFTYLGNNATSTNYIGETSGGTGSVGTTVPRRIRANATPDGSNVFKPLGIMARVKRLMDAANLPTDNRFMVADPVYYEQLGDEDSKILQAYLTGDSKSPLFNGRLMEQQLRGFDLYQSNNLPSGGTGPSTTDSSGTMASANYGTLIFGHRSAAATVQQIAKVEKLRSTTTMADIVRGLHVFGRGYIRSDALWVVRYQVGS